jgi:hypothetical protein
MTMTDNSARIRNPQSAIRNPQYSAIRNPQQIRNPQSEIRNVQGSSTVPRAVHGPQRAIRSSAFAPPLTTPSRPIAVSA